MIIRISSVALYVSLSIHEWYSWCTQDVSSIIESIPGTWSADQPKKYEPVSVSWFIKVAGSVGTENGAGERVYDETVFRKLLSRIRGQAE